MSLDEPLPHDEPAPAGVEGPEEREGLPAAPTLPVGEPGGAQRRTRCRLQVVSGPHEGLQLVTERALVRVGAHAENDLVLEEDRTASRHHFEIHYTERGHLLVDLGSTNGTFLDGRRVERAYLGPGSTLRAGASTLLFSPLGEEAASEPEPQEGELCGMVGQSAEMRSVFALIRRIAPLDTSVVIGGETGTGKELVARAVHQLSARRAGPFVVLDCGAIPADLIESELFGHEKGSFTGALAAREGAFERAHGGTIFLDELGELRLDLQPKLLRVLEAREVRRVGGNDVLPVDCRVIAATNRDLEKEVEAGRFREDLYFRLSVIHLRLPSLRERRGDIPLLIRHVLGAPEVLERHGPKRFSPEALQLLVDYAWPGNVRELENVLSHVLTFSEGEEVLPAHLPARLQGPLGEGPVPFNEHLSFKDAKESLLESFEREYVERVLRRCEGNLSRAARESGLHRKSIERLVKKHALDAKGMKPR